METTVGTIVLDMIAPAGGVVLGYLWNKARGLNKKQKSIEKGVRAILKMGLLRIYADNVSTGQISYDDERTAEELYETYHSLGGNGQGSVIIESIRKLKMVQR